LKKCIISVLIAAFSTFVYYHASTYISYYILKLDFINIDEHPDFYRWTPSSLILISSFVMILFSLIWLIGFRKILNQKNLLEDSIVSIQLKWVIYCLVGGSLFAFFPYFISVVFSSPEVHSKQFELWYLPALIATAITLPIAEELFFRRGILNLLATKMNLIVSILISSILFSAIHLPNYNQCVTTFIGGCILAFLSTKFSKLLYPILFHIGWNATVVILNFV